MKIDLDIEEIRKVVIEDVVDQFVSRLSEDGTRRLIEQRIDTMLKEIVNERCEKIMGPVAKAGVDALIIQTTNEWGEKKGAPVTFTEYCVQRADAYLQEKVSWEGKGQKDAGGYSWQGTQTRLTYWIHQHLHFGIENQMKDAAAQIIKGIAPSLAETVKLKISEVAAKIVVAR